MADTPVAETVPQNSLALEDASAIFAEAFKKEQAVPSDSKPAEVVETPTPVAAEVKSEVVPMEQTTTTITDTQAPEKKPTLSDQLLTNKDYEWLKTITDDATRERVAQTIKNVYDATHQIRTDAGRLSATQRQLNKLAEEKEALQSKYEEALKGKAKPTTDDLLEREARQENKKLLEKWDELSRTDPDITAAIQAKLDAQTGAVREAFEAKLKETQDKLASLEKPLTENIQKSAHRTEQEELTKKVPNWRDVVSQDIYQHWKEHEASPYQKVLVSSPSHLDSIEGLRAFNDWGIRNGLIAPPTQAAPDKASPKKEEEGESQADKIAKERAERQAASAPKPTVTPPIRPGSKNSGPVTAENAEALFREAYHKYIPKRS